MPGTGFTINVAIGRGSSTSKSDTFYIEPDDKTLIETVHVFIVSASEITSLQEIILTHDVSEQNS